MQPSDLESDALPLRHGSTVYVPQVNQPMFNHCPQRDLGEDGMSSVPCVILDPTPSVTPMKFQLDDRPPADAESIDSLAPSSSPSPHPGLADQLRKAPGVACHDRRLSSFAEVLRHGLVAASEGLSGASAVPISIWPISDVDRMEALGPEVPSIKSKPPFLDCNAAAVDFFPLCLPPEQGSADDTAVESSLSPLDAQVSHYDLTPTLAVDLDNTPKSISCLSRKYSLDTSSNVGPDSVSPSGSLADFLVGQTPDVSQVKYISAMEVIAMQYGPWKPAKSHRQRNSKNSTGSSGT